MREFTPKQARMLADKTQMEVAKSLGISRFTYRVLEANPERFTIRQAYLFAEAVGMSFDMIKFFSGNTQQNVEKKGR